MLISDIQEQEFYQHLLLKSLKHKNHFTTLFNDLKLSFNKFANLISSHAYSLNINASHDTVLLLFFLLFGIIFIIYLCFYLKFAHSLSSSLKVFI